MISISENDYYKLVNEKKAFPVILETNGDELTPISIFYNLEGENKFLLESVENSRQYGRYSFIGMDPHMSIKSSGSNIEVTRGNTIEKFDGDVLQYVKKYTDINYDCAGISFPFTGGAVGYTGYDIIRQYEKLPDNNVKTIDIPEAYLMFYKIFICLDHFKHSLFIVYNVFPEDNMDYNSVIEKVEHISRMCKSNKASHNLRQIHTEVEIESNFTADEFCSIVAKAKEYIVKGDIFQVVLSQRLTAKTNSNPFDVYRKLRNTNPSPYLFYIDYNDFQVVGSSPESLVRVYGDKVMTNPIAGTRPRGRDSIEDLKLKEELLSDEKERAEHLMLVDLGRNDIGKISEFGSVKVERFMEVDFYSHVMHIVSTVSGTLRKEFSCFEALKSCLPAGTVSGAPKVRAMEIIDELENVKRGLYAGAVGYFSYNGNMDTCIAIRTVIFKEGTAYLQAGAGIVYDSDPVSEYNETLSKLKALKEVI